MGHGSIHYLGYIIPLDMLKQKFKAEELAEVSHYEDRYSSKTGEKLAKKIKVVDRLATERYTYSGKSFDNYHELIDALSRDLKIDYVIQDQNPRFKRPQEKYIYVTLGLGIGDHQISYNSITNSDTQRRINELADKLQGLGFDLGPAHIVCEIPE